MSAGPTFHNQRTESRQANAFSRMGVDFSVGTIGLTLNSKNVAHGAKTSSITSAEVASTMATPPFPSTLVVETLEVETSRRLPVRKQLETALFTLFSRPVSIHPTYCEQHADLLSG